MQEHALQAVVLEDLVEDAVAVLVVAGDRVPGVRRVHSNLVGLAGVDLDFHQRRQVAKELHGLERADRFLAVRTHGDVPLAAALARLRASGKQIVSFGENLDQSQYLLAAQANEVYLDPMGSVLLEGLGIEGGISLNHRLSLLQLLRANDLDGLKQLFEAFIRPYVGYGIKGVL